VPVAAVGIHELPRRFAESAGRCENQERPLRLNEAAIPPKHFAIWREALTEHSPVQRSDFVHVMNQRLNPIRCLFSSNALTRAHVEPTSVLRDSSRARLSPVGI
jgi:hypothetical protein